MANMKALRPFYKIDKFIKIERVYINGDKMRIGMVVPTIRKECINDFFSMWIEEFTRIGTSADELYFYLIEDHDKKKFVIKKTIIMFLF